MDESLGFFAGLVANLGQWLERFVAYLPTLLGALAIVLLGWIAALLVRNTAHHLANFINRLLDRSFKQGRLSRARVPTNAFHFFGEIAFWLVFLFAVAFAARFAGLVIVSVWMDRAIAQMPNFLFGTVIIVIGYLAGASVGEQIGASRKFGNADQSVLSGRLAQALIFVLALTIGLDQFGIDISLLVVLFGISLGAVGIGLSVAFGLGARGFVQGMIGSRAVRRELKSGMSIELGDISGEIMEITPLHIVLDTAKGKLLVPAALVLDQPLLIVAPDRSADRPGDSPEDRPEKGQAESAGQTEGRQ